LSIKKQFLKTRPICKVTFRLSKEESRDARQIFLVGDFNNWNENKPPMKPLKREALLQILILNPAENINSDIFLTSLPGAMILMQIIMFTPHLVIVIIHLYVYNQNPHGNY